MMRNVPAFIVSKWLQEIVNEIPDNCNQCGILEKVLSAAQDMSLIEVIERDEDGDITDIEWVGL